MHDENDHEAVAAQKALYNWQIEQREQYIERLDSEKEAFVAEFTHFVSDLDADKAIFLRRVLQSIGDPALQAELVGIIMGYLVYGKGLTTEGKDPGEELRLLMEQDNDFNVQKAFDEASLTIKPAEEAEPSRMKASLNEVFQEEAAQRAEAEEEIQRATDYTQYMSDDALTMKQYNVRNRYAEGPAGSTPVWAGVECVKCKAKWLHLEHRMENFDCKGCQEITKWGHRV